MDVMLESDAVPLSASNSISSKGIGSTTQPRVDVHLLVTAHFVRTGQSVARTHAAQSAEGIGTPTKQLSVLCGCRNDLSRSFVETLEQYPSAAIVELGGHGSRFVLNSARASMKGSAGIAFVLEPLCPAIASKKGRPGHGRAA